MCQLHLERNLAISIIASELYHHINSMELRRLKLWKHRSSEICRSQLAATALLIFFNKLKLLVRSSRLRRGQNRWHQRSRDEERVEKNKREATTCNFLYLCLRTGSSLDTRL